MLGEGSRNASSSQQAARPPRGRVPSAEFAKQTGAKAAIGGRRRVGGPPSVAVGSMLCGVCRKPILAGEALLSVPQLSSRSGGQKVRVQQSASLREPSRRRVSLEADRRSFHAGCLSCRECGRPLLPPNREAGKEGVGQRVFIADFGLENEDGDGRSADWSASLLHAECAVRTCAACGETIPVGESFLKLPPREGRRKSLFFHRSCLPCASCGEALLESESVLLDGAAQPHHARCFVCCVCRRPLKGAYEAHEFFSDSSLLAGAPPVCPSEVELAFRKRQRNAQRPPKGAAVTAALGGCCCQTCAARTPLCVCCGRRAASFADSAAGKTFLPAALTAASAGLLRRRKIPFERRVPPRGAEGLGKEDFPAVLCGRCASLPSVVSLETAFQVLRCAASELGRHGLLLSPPLQTQQRRLALLVEKAPPRREATLSSQQQQPQQTAGGVGRGEGGSEALREKSVEAEGLPPCKLALQSFDFLQRRREERPGGRVAGQGLQGASPSADAFPGSHTFGCCLTESVQFRRASPSLVQREADALREGLEALVGGMALKAGRNPQKQQQQQQHLQPVPISSSGFPRASRSASERPPLGAPRKKTTFSVVRRICLAHGLPAAFALQHAAHELLHAFLAAAQVNVGLDEEGLCNVGASLVLQARLAELSRLAERRTNSETLQHPNPQPKLSAKASRRPQRTTGTDCSSCPASLSVEEDLLKQKLWALAVSSDPLYGGGYRRVLRRVVAACGAATGPLQSGDEETSFACDAVGQRETLGALLASKALAALKGGSAKEEVALDDAKAAKRP